MQETLMATSMAGEFVEVAVGVPIVVLQTSCEGYGVMRDLLRDSGLVENESYHLTSKPAVVQRLIARDKRQLLVTGSIRGTGSETAEFVDAMRAKNRELTVVSYSCLSRKMHKIYLGPYDLVIEKDGLRNFELLKEEMQKFLRA
jgi:hypothetical protein